MLYNIGEGTVSILAGASAGSIALVGFGLDSFVESLSGAVMIWRFSRRGAVAEVEERRIEKKATRLVGYSFLALAAYVSYQSAKKLYFRETPAPSILGIGIALVSLTVMPVLFLLKYRTGQALKSRSLVLDAKETLACVFLSAALRVGLSANYLLCFGGADSLVGLVVAGFLARESYATLKEELGAS